MSPAQFCIVMQIWQRASRQVIEKCSHWMAESVLKNPRVGSSILSLATINMVPYMMPI